MRTGTPLPPETVEQRFLALERAWSSRHAGRTEDEVPHDVDDAAAAVASHIMLSAFEYARSNARNAHHPFHPDALDDTLSFSRALDTALETRLGRRDRTGPWAPRTWAEYPAVARHVSAAELQRVLRAEVEVLAAIADSHEFVWTEVGDSFVVEHVASSLRARFYPHDVNGHPGTVYTRPFDVPSPTGADTDGRAYIGLGIGRRIYRVGAGLRPDVRWSAAPLIRPPAVALRKVLHQEDPFVWQGECSWCEPRGIVWLEATREDYATHPHPAFSTRVPELVRPAGHLTSARPRDA